jgi:hypothetical protein
MHEQGQTRCTSKDSTDSDAQWEQHGTRARASRLRCTVRGTQTHEQGGTDSDARALEQHRLDGCVPGHNAREDQAQANSCTLFADAGVRPSLDDSRGAVLGSVRQSPASPRPPEQLAAEEVEKIMIVAPAMLIVAQWRTRDNQVHLHANGPQEEAFRGHTGRPRHRVAHLHRVVQRGSKYRKILTGQPVQFEPPQSRRDPDDEESSLRVKSSYADGIHCELENAFALRPSQPRSFSPRLLVSGGAHRGRGAPPVVPREFALSQPLT